MNNVQHTEQKHSSFISKIKSFSSKIREFIKLDQTKKGWRKVMSSLWSIVLGLFVAMIFIAIVSKNNPFLFFKQIIKGFGSHTLPTFYKYLLIFGFSGLACAIGFKAGLFNIGISGQMMVSAIFSFSMFITLNRKDLGADMLFLGMIGTIVLSFLVAMLAGALKAYLNVHEVITTILLNWIIVYLGSFIFSSHSNVFSETKKKIFISDEYTGAAKGVFSISNQNTQLFMAIGFILLISAIFAIWFILKFTTTGYKIKMLGISKTNGKYMGVNDKLLTMLVMGTSGALAGLAGFYLYIFKEGTFVDANVLQPLGFEAIAVSLLALNSPIGIIFTTLFYATLYNGTIFITLYPLSLKADYINIITALILYFAAISQILMAFKPGLFLWKLFIKMSYKEYWLFLKLTHNKKLLANKEKRYNIKAHRIYMNICKQNEQIMFKKLEILTNKFENTKTNLLIKITLIDKLILEFIKYTNLTINVHKLELHKKYLYAFNIKQIKEDFYNKISSIKKSNNPNKKAEILALKTKKLQKLSLLKSSLENEFKNIDLEIKKLVLEKTDLKAKISQIEPNKSISFKQELRQIHVNDKSNNQMIKELKKAHNIHKDLFLKSALEKNSSNETVLEKFSDIANKRREFDKKTFELGKFIKVDIKQQHRSNLRTIALDFKKSSEQIYQTFMSQYFIAYFNAKGGRE